MPRRRNPMTLARSCLRTITLYFDEICYGTHDLESKLLENDEHSNIKGPFVDWPGAILYDILEAVSERYSLSKKHLHMIIQPQLRTLNLSFGMGDIVSGFSLIQERCQNLQHLVLSYLKHLHPKSLVGLIPCVTHLLSLDLRMTLVSDEALALIGKCLNELVCLNLSGTCVTDMGIINLALAEDGTHLSKKLTRLFITDTWVTHGGAALLITYLPELRELDYEKILEALELIYNWCPELEHTLLNKCGARMKETPTKSPQCLRLNTISSLADSMTDYTLEAAVNLCPDINNFSITNAWIMNEHLYKLMALDKLTSLSLSSSDTQTIDFKTGVLPILSACGENLKNLILTNIAYVNVPDVGRTCLNIQNIAFSKVSVFDVDSPCSLWFNHLEAMELWAEENNEMNPNLIRQLVFYSPNLRNLLFSGCLALTDELVFEILKVNPIENLTRLTLDRCNQVTPVTLHAVLDSSNDLSILRTWSCPNITKDDKEVIENRILCENMDIYFDWYPVESEY